MDKEFMNYPILGEYLRIVNEGTIEQRSEFVDTFYDKLSYESIIYDASKNDGKIKPHHMELFRRKMGGRNGIHKMEEYVR
jgi:hypothetical protein